MGQVFDGGPRARPCVKNLPQRSLCSLFLFAGWEPTASRRTAVWDLNPNFSSWLSPSWPVSVIGLPNGASASFLTYCHGALGLAQGADALVN